MLDYILIVISGLTVFAQAMLGLLVTTRPPSEKRRIYYEVAFGVLGIIGCAAIIWGGIRANQSSNALNINIVGIKTSLPTPAAISQAVIQSETNAHLETYLYIDNFTASGAAAINLIATNSGNATIKINRIEAFSGGMTDSENDVGFERVLQPDASASKFILIPKAINGPPALTIEILYQGVKQGKSENLLSTCRFNVNKTSPTKINIYPMDCQESPGDSFIKTEEA
jgi:hypothetical protein